MMTTGVFALFLLPLGLGIMAVLLISCLFCDAFPILFWAYFPIPVSYTHLDVYKRQGPKSWPNISITGRMAGKPWFFQEKTMAISSARIFKSSSRWLLSLIHIFVAVEMVRQQTVFIRQIVAGADSVSYTHLNKLLKIAMIRQKPRIWRATDA